MLKYSNLIITNLYNQFIDYYYTKKIIINKMNKQIWVKIKWRMNSLIAIVFHTSMTFESKVGKWMNI